MRAKVAASQRSGRRHGGPGRADGDPLAVELLRLQRAAGNRAVQRLVAAGCCASCARGGPCGAEVEAAAVAPVARFVVQRLPAPADPDIDTDEIEALGAGRGPVVQREDAEAAPVPGAACPVFADLTGFRRRNRGANAFAALTAFRFGRRGGRFQATWSAGGSWVNTFQVPMSGARTPRVTAMVGRCRRAFLRQQAATFDVTPDASCPAVAAGSHQATTVDECDTVIGAELHAEAVADIPRLAEHEQYHLRLACVLADLANAALDAGGSAKRIGAQLATAARRETRRYDRETHHGCDASAQASWQADLDAGIARFP